MKISDLRLRYILFSKPGIPPYQTGPVRIFLDHGIFILTFPNIDPAPSRMILPLPARSSLLPILIPPAFSQTLAHLTLHPPILLHHLSTEYLILPPPHSPPAKFWPIFTGLSTRDEGERLVWGADGTGWSDETVVELVVRSASGKRTIERSLEGWKRSGVCQLEDLWELKHIWNRNAVSLNSVERCVCLCRWSVIAVFI